METKGKFTVCRLCLEVTLEDTYEAIDDNKRSMLQAIIPDIDLSMDRNLNMCKVCSGKISAFYEFKHSFLENNNFTIPESCKTLQTENVRGMKQSDYAENGKCCFCQEIFNSLQLLDTSPIILRKYFLDVESLKHRKLKSCENCTHILEHICAFNITCKTSAQKIHEYCSILNVTPRDVNLYEVYQFLFKSSVESDIKINVSSFIKLEDEERTSRYPIRERAEVVRLKQDRVRILKKCSSETKRKANLRQQLPKHNGPAEVKMLKGIECSFRTKYGASLRFHSLKHKKPVQIKLLRCVICHYETKRKSHMNRHLLTHKSSAETVMFRCDMCSYETKRKDNFKRHLSICIHPREMVTLKCKECPYETKYRTTLEKHLLAHKKHSKKMLRCRECQFETVYRTSFNLHLLKHKSPSKINLRVLACQICDYETQSKSHLIRHSFVHTTPTLFECKNCSYKTNRKDNLKRHLLNIKKCAEEAKYKDSREHL